MLVTNFKLRGATGWCRHDVESKRMPRSAFLMLVGIFFSNGVADPKLWHCA